MKIATILTTVAVCLTSVERKDGSLWMLVRRQGMAETVSHDGGNTWSIVKQSSLRHPTARFLTMKQLRIVTAVCQL